LNVLSVAHKERNNTIIMKRIVLTIITIALMALVSVGVTAQPAAAEEANQPNQSSPELLFKLRGEPLHWFSFTVAEYYLDDINQENGTRARNIINSHLEGATYRFYSDYTVEFTGGPGMPSSLKYLSGTWEYDREEGMLSFVVGRPGLEPNLTLSFGGFAGWIGEDNNLMMGYIANYNRYGHWHAVVGTLSQDVDVIYMR
jgi:hypothetical protein